MMLLDTSRQADKVTLRPATPDDARLLEQWRTERSVKRFQPIGIASASQLRTELERQEIGDIYRGHGEKFQWIVSCAEQPAGWITLVVTNWDHGLAEIGYALSTPYQNQGLMPHALTQLLADLFLQTKLERIEARCAIDNTPSQRVLERVGFSPEGRLRGYFVLGGERVDNYLFAILRDDFLPAPADA
jgi:RimJ/RimL family protein N-acetyltransferase